MDRLHHGVRVGRQRAIDLMRLGDGLRLRPSVTKSRTNNFFYRDRVSWRFDTTKTRSRLRFETTAKSPDKACLYRDDTHEYVRRCVPREKWSRRRSTIRKASARGSALSSRSSSRTAATTPASRGNRVRASPIHPTPPARADVDRHVDLVVGTDHVLELPRRRSRFLRQGVLVRQ
jgi:hypothetical protein